MLVKIKEDSKVFAEAIRIAKRHFDVRTASGAAKHVVLEYPRLISQQNDDLNKIKNLERKLEKKSQELEKIKAAISLLRNI